jgi:PAS domain S-box-containing protein
MTAINHSSGTEEILRQVAEGTASDIGGEFLQSLVLSLASVLRVRYTFVSEFFADQARVRTLAYSADGKLIPNKEFSVAGTPCERVLNGEMRLYERGIQELFPADKALVRLNAQGYLAVPLIGKDQVTMGHLAVMDDKPLSLAESDLSVFRIFANRACAEAERLRAEKELQAARQRLAGILASAMDVIITIAGNRHITMFNDAAARVFRCSADWAIGQPFDRFLSKPFRHLFDEFLRGAAAKGGQQQFWAPEGLTAVRADREEFPVECTISEIHVGTETFYAVILRDLNERRKAEDELRRLRMEAEYLREQVDAQAEEGVVIAEAHCPAMSQVMTAVVTVAPTPATVLLTGETGVGKQVIARAIHDASPRSGRLLVTVNCAALPGDLVESELFGHEKGAFTGATGRRAGRFEIADGGTLFLDEVGELTASAQAKLLRVLQDREFERVGGEKTLRTDVRVIAATNRDLGQQVKEGKFRADLFYRLNVFPIHIPPLRERVADISLLADHFIAVQRRKLGKPLGRLSRESLDRLRAYSWPGNVRELQNVIERAAILAKGEELVLDLPLDDRAQPVAAPSPGGGTLRDVERNRILEALQQTGWRIDGKRGAAVRLGVGASTLRYRMKILGIKREGV